MNPRKPASLDWIDDTVELKEKFRQNPSLKRKEIAQIKQCSASMARYYESLLIFNDEDLQKVRQAAQASDPFILSFKSASTLAGLKGNPEAFREALNLVLAHRLALLKVKALVAWARSGKAVTDFDHTKIKRKEKILPLSENPQAEGLWERFLNFIHKLFRGPRIASESPAPAEKPKKTSLLVNALAGNSPVKIVKNKVKKGEEISAGETALIAGDRSLRFIDRVWKAVKPILHKAWELDHRFAKGAAETLAPHSHNRHGGGMDRLVGILWHHLVYLFFLVWPVWVLSGALPFTRRLILYGLYRLARWLTVDLPSGGMEWVKHNWIEAAVAAAVALVVLVAVPRGWKLTTMAALALLVWLWVFARTGGVGNPLVSISQAPVTTSDSLSKQTSTNINFVSPSDKRNRHKYPPASRPQAERHDLAVPISNSTQEMGADLAAKVAAGWPEDVSVQAVTVTPADTNEPMAVSRLGDMATEDYALAVGRSLQRVTTVNPTNLSLAVQCANGNPLGALLGGSGSAAGFYWEDVLALYCCEGTVNPKGQAHVFYQVAVKATGHDDPFVIQCRSLNELKHLVSSMEFFIRLAGAPASRTQSEGQGLGAPISNQEMGGGVPVLGLPYFDQGLVLNSEGRVTALWKDSPADRAALNLGDYLWSVDTPAQQGPEQLGKALQALTPGEHWVYSAATDDWEKALTQRGKTPSAGFHPKLEKWELVVP